MKRYYIFTLLLLFTPLFSSAVLFDTFDDYSTGYINDVTGGNWFEDDSVSDSIQIKSNVYKSSPNSLGCTAVTCHVATTSLLLSTTFLRHQFSYYADSNNSSTFSLVGVSFDSQSDSDSVARVYISVDDFCVDTDNGGAVCLDSAYEFTNLIDEWIDVIVEFDFVNKQMRAMYESISTTTPWTDWEVWVSTSTPSHLYIDGPNSDDYYIDNWGGSYDQYPSLNFNTTAINSIWSPSFGYNFGSDGNDLAVVPFQFTYHTATTSYDYVGIEVRALTAGFQYAPVEDSITATGTMQTFQRNMVLPAECLNGQTGCDYTWRPYLRNSSSGTYVYYQGGNFWPFQVSASGGQSEVDEVLSWLATYGGSTTDPSISDGADVTSGDFCLRFSNICGKFPFSYAVDFVTVFNTLRSAVEIDQPNVALPYSFPGATSTVTIIDYTASSTNVLFKFTEPIRAVGVLALWFFFGVWAFGFASKLV